MGFIFLSTFNQVIHFCATSDSLAFIFSLIPKLKPCKDCFLILVLDLVMGPLTCYMAAIMQVVFLTRYFMSRYYLNQSLKKAFELSPAYPTVDLNMQLN
ncbi:Ubiquitin carboxyl-terminal hydrolase 14, partial [Mucuna pruriens]